MIKKAVYIIFLTIMACNERPRPEEEKLFSLMEPSHTHIGFSNTLTENEQFNIIDYLYFNNGGGVAAGDINNDGLVDLYFTASQLPNRLYLNKGGLVFEDITDKAGVGGTGDWTTGVTMADVNGDGYLDIHICQVSHYKGLEGANQLFINNGDLTFTDRAAEYGIDFQGFSTQAAFFDYDLDGDLDLFLLNHSVHSTRTYGQVDMRGEYDPASGDRLYRNELSSGYRRFTVVTQSSGIYSSQIGYGLNVTVSDLNHDGYPDLFVSNDFHENDYLYINNRDGTFTDHFTEMMAHSSRSSMGNDIGDFNNDGLPDILVLDMLPAAEEIRQRAGGEDDYDVYQIKRKYGYHDQFVRNNLHLNLGVGLFSEIGRLAGIHATDWSWSPLWCDLDNDGWKDLYITNGIFRRPNDLDYIRFLTSDRRYMRPEEQRGVPDRVLYEKMPLDSLVNYAFKNNRDYTFSNKAEEWGFDQYSFSNGSAYADLDNDGDLDLAVNNINAPAFIYRNNSETMTGRHYISFHFSGERSNRFGLGARVILYHEGTIQVAENYTTRGFFSSVAPTLHFGLDTLTYLDSVDIYWAGGKVRRMYDVKADQMVHVSEAEADREFPIPDFRKEEILFEKVKNRVKGLDFHHRENNFTDFIYERLMPHSLSSEGPCLAVSDVNGDGLDDIYFGGAHDQQPVLYVQERDGSFRRSRIPAFENSAFYEDVDAVFFDADQDGDPDLYVVSGGNEYRLPNPLMKDRLYLNDGQGNFELAADRLPVFYHNGSCVAPFDYDEDGDIDLFVGSRSIPRAYGLPPDSYLLINNGNGYFSDGTTDLAPALTGLGMVTDAVWTDADNDGDPDLAIVGEWMPLTVFINTDGKLVKSDTGQMTNTAGWWFTLAAFDIDNDGDEDLIAGNLGLNAYLKPSSDEPIRMYINDFDGNGVLDQIVTFHKNGKEYPFASADDLFRQIPAMKREFTTYADFAGKEIHQILPQDKLVNSITRNVYCFESGIFVNDGQGNYEMKALPVEAQFSPIRDMLIVDMDADGISDILAGGNYNSVVPYYGHYDASHGWFLKGQGGSNFEVVFPSESGLAIRGEVNDMEMVRSAAGPLVLFGINNRQPEVYRLKGQ